MKNVAISVIAQKVGECKLANKYITNLHQLITRMPGFVARTTGSGGWNLYSFCLRLVFISSLISKESIPRLTNNKY